MDSINDFENCYYKDKPYEYLEHIDTNKDKVPIEHISKILNYMSDEDQQLNEKQTNLNSLNKQMIKQIFEFKR